ncbi:MAG: C13 family peptidase, partial [Pseudomonadota bacterium]
FFFSLIVIANIYRRIASADKLIVIFLSIAPVVWLITICLYSISTNQSLLNPYYAGWTVFVVYSAWYLSIAFRIFRRFFYTSSAKAFGLVLIYTAFNFPFLFILPSMPLWQPYYIETEAGTEDKEDIVDIESIYYQQENLLENQLSQVTSGDEQKTEMYFIGFAGYADEDVFMNEVMLAEQIIGKRYATNNKSTLLINNPDTVNQYPLANKYNLDFVLQDYYRKMNDEDVLFLFLSSHGSEAHELSTSFYPFRLNDIDPATLKSVLQANPIQWKIIIVSACYSGGFLEKLAESKTFVITASRGDRNSFGCGHDGNYTYFGEAFFENGIKKGLSLEAAFQQAKKLIKEKEDAMEFINSEPQYSLGSEFASKLYELENIESEQHGNNWATTSYSVTD